MSQVSRNRRLLWIAALVVVLASTLGSIRFAGRPSDFVDFGQFYMGGLMARARAWNDLYPRPMPGSNLNAGFPNASTMSPYYAKVAEQTGVGDSYRYINPPPFALLLWPLSLFHPAQAKWAWLFAMACCGWATAVYAGLFFEHLTGVKRYAGPFIALFLAFSPRMIRSICMSNVSPWIALTTAVAMGGLVWRRERSGALGFVLGAATKYATLSLLPIILVARRWKLMAEISAAGVVFLVISLCIMGPQPYFHFLADIAPTLGRSTDTTGNDSVAIIVAKMFGGSIPTPAESLAIALFQWAVFAVLLLTIIRAAPRLHLPATLFAAGAAMYGWMLIFSPIFWQHYVIYIFPFWGWLIWEVGRKGWPRCLALFVLAATWFPSSTGMGSILGGRLGHVVNASHYLLLAMFGLLAVSIHRLLRDPLAGDALTGDRSAGRASQDATDPSAAHPAKHISQQR